jgi:hypothetical protein
MNTNFDFLIISPHFCDAATSLGQHIINWRKLGKTVKIVTVFNSFGTEELMSENSWNYLLKYGVKNVRELTKLRLQADKQLISSLDYESQYLNYVDASFRHFSEIPVYDLAQSLLSGRPSTYDHDLPDKIIHDLALDPNQKVVFPYGVGNHVDHVILRKIGDKLKKLGQPISFYLESPELWRDLNYLKYSWQIIRATSYTNQVSQKMSLLKYYAHENFPEVIVTK